MGYASYLALGTLFSVLTRYLLRSLKHSQLPLPPGPRKLPLIKNILDLPTERQWLTFSKWAEDYDTDILHVEAAGHSIVVLQSEEAINELLVKRSAIYSGRSVSRVLYELVGWDWFMPFMPNNNLWREHRRLFQRFLHPSDTSLRSPHEKQNLHVFLNHLLQEPQDFIAHIRHMIGAVIISMTFGIPVKSTHDPHVKLAECTMSSLAKTLTPGAFFADTFYFLRHIPEGFPGTGWKAKVRELQHEMLESRHVAYDAALAAIAGGTSMDSVVSRCQREFNEGRLTQSEQNIVRDFCSTAFLAGADTTVCAITTFFLACLCFPEAYEKAQEEVDRVLVGRLPEPDDKNSMPYLDAFLREILRWQPVGPLGLPHALARDDVYKGYHIPAGSLVIANVWALCHNPEKYPQPEKVKPERFLKDGKLHIPDDDPVDANFGFGRRVCPGRQISESSLFRVAASTLLLFDVTKAVDVDGNIIEPTVAFTGGLARQPIPFKCSIKPRSEAAVKLIHSFS